MKNKHMIRTLTVLLTVMLCMTAFSTVAFASGEDTAPTSEAQTEPTNSTDITGDDLSELISALFGSMLGGTEKSGKTGTVTTNGGKLNVRTGAGLNNYAFTQLPNGTVVEVVGTDGDWYMIRLPEKIGYVYSGYMTLSDAGGEADGGLSLSIDPDKARGTLKEFSDESGYETFVIPDDVGGRYSVLTACGLLPIAAAGIDIDKIMAGAARAAKELSVCDADKNDAYRYAVIRNILHKKGKAIEIMACYEPAYQYMNEWWKQLFGESEGKDGKGIFPTSVIYSTDLHSLGQIVQEGVRNIFETVIDIQNTGNSFIIPDDPQNVDKLNFISGKDLNEANKKAFLATAFAHSDGNVPNIVLEVAARDEDSYGYLVYFFEVACAASGYMLGVNPFNQPGVEAYKKNMFALLGKPGAENEARRKELEARL